MLESEIDENLLKFFVDEIDAKLFESVFLEDFKAVNIENSDVEFLGRLLHFLIDGLNLV